MTAHGSIRHKRAVKALFRRKPTGVNALKERFSPTAIFPGMTDIPDINDPLPGVEHNGHGHLQTPEISDPTDPTDPIDPIIPIIPITPTVAPAPVTTPSSIQILSQTSASFVLSTAIPTTPTIDSPISSTISSITSSTSRSIASTRINPEITANHSIPSAVPSTSSASDSSSSGVSTGAIVGGVGAGIIAVAAIGFAVAFFFRRVRKRELDDATGFDARDFRRSGVMLPDPPTHEDTVNRGYNPPPLPPMMQQNHQAPMPASAWGYAEPYYESNAAGHGIHSQYRDASGRALSSVTSAQTFVTAPVRYYEQNPIASAPLPSPHEQSAANSPVLTRQPSNNSIGRQTLAQSTPTVIAPYPTLTRQPTLRNAQIPADDYVDLSRSSVSPFQAAQYAEISRRLNHPSEASPTMVSPAQIYATQQKELPPVPDVLPVHGPSIRVADSAAVSPFDNQEPSTSLSPQSVQETLKMESVATPVAPLATEPVSPPSPTASTTPMIAGKTSSPFPPTTLNVQTMHLPASSTDSIFQEELEFPVPPSPTVSYASRYRADSLPPVLPEIKIQERSSVSSYIPGSPMIGSGYISGMTDTSRVSGFSGIPSMGLQPVGPKSEGRFVPAPSPLASSFTAPEGKFAEAQENALRDGIHTSSAEIGVKATGPSTASAGSKTAELKRPETFYDLDDAYGGF